MQILPFLSHMPYADGENLICCFSPGAQEFPQPQTAFDISHNISIRTTRFQPWQLGIQDVDGFHTVTHPLWITSPMRVFCNPVLNGNEVSFIFARQLYTARITGFELTNLSVVSEGLFTGFKVGNRTVLGKAPCATGSQLILIDGQKRQALNTSFDHILRVVPFKSGLIMTGRKGEELVSVLWLNGTANRILANGKDVYKCCLTDNGSTVIHAVRTDGGFEERYLHSDTAEFVEMPDFLQTN